MVLVSRDPATDEPLGTVPIASRRQVDEAFDAARDAQPAWATTPWKERDAILSRFRRLLMAQREDLANLVTRESGKPLVESLMADVLPALEFAKHLQRLGPLKTEKVRLHNPLLMGRRSHVERVPVGVVGVIAPWNYPLTIPATGLLTALMAGNGAVLKPAEQTPLVGQRLVDLLHEAGVPRDILAIVHGAAHAGQAVVHHSDGVVFTGSVSTGKKVAAACAKKLVPACVELGGKDPMLLMPGKRPSGAHGAAVWGAFSNAGQTCAAVERLYVPTSELAGTLADLRARTEALRVGHGLGPVDMGPVIDDASVKRILGHIHDAEKQGAEIVCGGEVMDAGPRFIAPTILTGVDHTMDCMREETFGPTLPIMPYDTLDEAVALCNDTDYGLTASVWGDGADAIAPQLQAGTVMINECVYTYAAPETPWTGWKDSGHGITHGQDLYHAVTQVQHIHKASGKPDPWHYPYDEDLGEFLDGGMRFLHGGSLAGGLKALRKR